MSWQQPALAGVLVALALLACRLSRRDPSWRSLTTSLVLLAAVDLARLYTGPLAQTKAQPWWCVDVFLVAVWPTVLALGLYHVRPPRLDLCCGVEVGTLHIRHQHVPVTVTAATNNVYTLVSGAVATLPGLSDTNHVLPRPGRPGHWSRSGNIEPQRGGLVRRQLRKCFTCLRRRRSHQPTGTVTTSTRKQHGTYDERVERFKGCHVCLLPRLVLLVLFAVALGLARPWLPRLVYLDALRLPRWALAVVWLEAVAKAWKRKRPGPRTRSGPICRAFLPDVGGPPRSVALPPAHKVANLPCRPDSGSPALASYDASLQKDRASIYDDVTGWRQLRQALRSPRTLALILCGGNVVDLVAGAWLCAPWDHPTWGYARFVTWIVYGVVGLGLALTRA